MIFPFNIYQFLKSPEDYLLTLKEKFGDPFPLSFPGTPDIWLTSDPALAKIIFTAPPDSFKTSDKNPVGPLLGPSGLIMQSWPLHLGQRKEFSPYFSKNSLIPFSSAIMNSFFDLYDDLNNQGELIVQEFSLKSSLKIILKFLFPHLTPNEYQEAEKLTEDFLKSYSASYLFVPTWIPGTWKKFNQSKNELDHRFYEFFSSGRDFLENKLLRSFADFKKEEVLDHIRTFIVAGHETSATSLSWALYHIHNDPYVMNRLQEELIFSPDISKEKFLENILENKFLESIVLESLRIQPPVPFITRKIINRNFSLGDRSLAIGQELGVCISLLHRDSSVWQDAAQFRPDRFVENKYSCYEYAPFGGGTRKCIGAELALLELKILIGLFVKHFHSELIGINQPKPEVMQITIGPKKPIKLLYRKIHN